jgi:hypothetical protein
MASKTVETEKDTGFWCGIVVGGKQCLHESRRKALDCTRRLMKVDAENGRVLIESELTSVLADRDGLVKLDHEKNNKIEAQVTEIDGLKKKIAELETKVKEQANTILSLGKPAADAVQQATTDLAK